LFCAFAVQFVLETALSPFLTLTLSPFPFHPPAYLYVTSDSCASFLTSILHPLIFFHPLSSPRLSPPQCDPPPPMSARADSSFFLRFFLQPLRLAEVVRNFDTVFPRDLPDIDPFPGSVPSISSAPLDLSETILRQKRF